MTGNNDYQQKRWAEKKVDIINARRHRYQTDPEYRERVRESVRRSRQKRADAERPAKYVHLLKNVCEDLGLKVSSFHTMVYNGHIPRPYKHRRKAYLTENQKTLLEDLVETIDTNSRKQLSHPSEATALALQTLNDKWEL